MISSAFARSLAVTNDEAQDTEVARPIVERTFHLNWRFYLVFGVISVRVRVSIDKGTINLTLPSADCRPGGSDGRRPDRETAVFEKWERLGLGSRLQAGQLIAFLKQIC